MLSGPFSSVEPRVLHAVFARSSGASSDYSLNKTRSRPKSANKMLLMAVNVRTRLLVPLTANGGVIMAELDQPTFERRVVVYWLWDHTRKSVPGKRST
jgi:hypothetical protein